MFDLFEAGRGQLPVVDQVELTNVCPMTCFMCPTGAGTMTRPTGFMDRALFDRLIDEIAPHQIRWKPLTLHNLGESALHPELVALVALAAARGLPTELSSNPGFVPLELYRALAGAGLSRLVLDIDGLDVATLENARGKAVRAARAFENLDAILKDREAASAARPEIVLQMIRLDVNRHQHAEFLERYGTLWLPGVEAYLKDADANTDVSVGHRVFVGAQRPRPMLCRAPWRSVVVLWDGRVVPCCHDANGETILGDLNQSSLAEIWSGPAASELRARLESGAIREDEPCWGCAHRPDRYARPSLLGEVPVRPLHW
jgi:radical SAM protein with 4Fe4S-binding SPASM domain